eukprot:gene10817-3435_t
MNKNAYQEARKRLLLSLQPTHFPGREEEIEKIKTSLLVSISCGSGMSMFVSGGTGTGKTATLTHILNELKELSNIDEIPFFLSIFINCVKLKSKKESFKIVWNEIKEEYKKRKKKILKIGNESDKISNIPTKITQYFDKYENDPYIIIIIDEIDFLINKQQQELYEFFNWSQRKGVAVIDDLNIFEKKALELCSKKVSSKWGDVRKAFEICKRSIEISEEKNGILRTINTNELLGGRKRRKLNDQIQSNQLNEQMNKPKLSNHTLKFKSISDDDLKITTKDISESFNDLYSNEEFPLEQLPLIEQLYLISILQSQKISIDKNSYVNFENVIHRIQIHLNILNEKVLNLNQLLPSLNLLIQMNLIQSKSVFEERFPKLRLLISDSDVLNNLNDLIQKIKI